MAFMEVWLIAYEQNSYFGIILTDETNWSLVIMHSTTFGITTVVVGGDDFGLCCSQSAWETCKH